MPIFLSICIPTYNRGFYLNKTLNILSDQINNLRITNVEIVVVDGNSTDDTSIIVNNYINKYKFIRYFKKKINGGVSRDYYLSIKNSLGKFCWMMSSDDLIEKDGVSKIVNI